MLARYELRRRWRGAVVLTLLVGVVGAVVLAATAGARRTDSALARFNLVSRSADVTLLPALGYIPTDAEVAQLRALPEVESATALRSFAVFARGAPDTLIIGAARDAAG